jgi:ABC-type polysaccharide/polyol phosphate export permease
MTGGFPEPAGAGPASVPARTYGPWVHRSAHGLEIGGEQPSGEVQGALAALFGAFATTWRMRKTLWVLVLKDFKSRYRAQALGLLWSFAYPLVMMATISVAFIYILRVTIPNFTIFYLIAAVFWQWFQNATLAATGTYIDNGPLVKRTAFPRYLLPVAAVLANGINFLMEWILVVGFFFVFPKAYTFNITLVALVPLAALQLFLLVGVGLITSTLNVRYRDVYYIVTSVLTIGFWASPILYSTQMAPPLLRHLLRLNPLAGIMESARDIVMRGQWPAAVNLVPALVTGILVFLVGCAVFRRQNLRLSDHV